MEIPLVDYHCHLDLYPDFERLIKYFDAKKIYTLAVTTTPRAWPRNYELASRTTFVKPALGFHPQLVASIENEFPIFEKYFSECKYIGEIGLDAGPKFYKSLPTQKRIFEHIIKLAAMHGNKIISIHSIRSVPDVLRIIYELKAHLNNKIVFHWFSGTIQQAKDAIRLGCYFSVNLQMLQSEKGFELIRIIPDDRLLTETDGPFTLLNGKPQTPADIIYCLNALSRITKKTTGDIRSIVWNNVINLEN